MVTKKIMIDDELPTLLLLSS